MLVVIVLVLREFGWCTVTETLKILYLFYPSYDIYLNFTIKLIEIKILYFFYLFALGEYIYVRKARAERTFEMLLKKRENLGFLRDLVFFQRRVWNI